MPIVIKELVITAVVDGNADQHATSAATASPEAQQQIIQVCVEQVLAILEEKKER
ncbi:DUF5908 family protein [Hymenobacter sp. GOD-10R]|uniref:DUF5908 family protein n=1 Tax=Hymenobacter sp. GOD-10R TaxID=3093922 RepID=UPI002D766EEC|nr:DUF5908 family protein [Hymenobacter sp. GOD-10R]WRQ30099.1 DUF5908 family protein [Hymenobacter sp. GOD-10R]